MELTISHVDKENAHTYEKASCGYIMEEVKYNQMGLARYIPYEEFLHLASQKKRPAWTGLME